MLTHLAEAVLAGKGPAAVQDKDAVVADEHKAVPSLS